MRKLDQLQFELEQESELAILNGLPFIHTIRAFSKVVDDCFGQTLLDSFLGNIKMLKRLNLLLGVTVTPKVKLFYKNI